MISIDLTRRNSNNGLALLPLSVFKSILPKSGKEDVEGDVYISSLSVINTTCGPE